MHAGMSVDVQHACDVAKRTMLDNMSPMRREQARMSYECKCISYLYGTHDCQGRYARQRKNRNHHRESLDVSAVSDSLRMTSHIRCVHSDRVWYLGENAICKCAVEAGDASEMQRRRMVLNTRLKFSKSSNILHDFRYSL